MYKQILVPLDGSQLAESVLPYVSCLSEALRVPVELLYVQDPKQTTSFSRPSQEVDYLKNIASSMLASSTVRYAVEIGKPAEVIVNTASRDAGTLITMATYGRTRIQHWLFGSVASDVLYASRNPLVLTHGTQEKQVSNSVQVKTIVVLLDGSALAEKIFPYVVEISEALESEVILIGTYSLPRTSYSLKRFHVPYTDQLAENVKNAARTYLERKVQEFTAKGVARVSYRMMEDCRGAEMMNLARNTRVDMVATVTPIKSGVGRFDFKNVPERIMRRWDKPLLVVRG